MLILYLKCGDKIFKDMEKILTLFLDNHDLFFCHIITCYSFLASNQSIFDIFFNPRA
jgi:hypothetical protein